MVNKKKQIYVLQPTIVNKPVQHKLKEIFKEPIKHMVMSEIVITDYNDTEQIKALCDEIYEKILSIVRGNEENEDNLDIYVISSGGILHAMIISMMLSKVSISFKILAYDVTQSRYIIVNPENYLVV